MKGDEYMRAHGWSELARGVGAFFVEAGVQDGVCGKLFDLRVAQVEGLIDGQAELEGHGQLDAHKPLISLAVLACWTLQTLAHHTAQPEEWIPLANAISGIVRLVAPVPEDAVTRSMIRGVCAARSTRIRTGTRDAPDGAVAPTALYKTTKVWMSGDSQTCSLSCLCI
jgi:hypothetical protein